MTTYIIASNNKKKLVELKRILTPLGINAVTANEIGINLDEVEETGLTFAENAYLKAKSACELSGLPAVADDSGLSVDALDGRPGVYSARYCGENATDLDRINKILEELSNIPDEQRTAHFTSSVCCVYPNGNKITAEGKCFGKIAFEPVGDNGFGYDPVFIYNNKSFAQMSAEEKDIISHRGIALRRFYEELTKYLEENK